MTGLYKLIWVSGTWPNFMNVATGGSWAVLQSFNAMDERPLKPAETSLVQLV
jgi:hypothetical protein